MATSGPRPRVLLIEDDDVERSLLAELLEGEGISVIGEAPNGALGVDLAHELRPDVVLTDLRMPVVNGIEATRLIREELPATQVIVLTVYEGGLPSRSAEEIGAYAYLVKGCSISLIRDVINQAFVLKTGLERDAAAGEPPATPGASLA